MTFRKDLKLGQAAEAQVKNLLKNANFSIDEGCLDQSGRYINTAQDKYDILSTLGTFKCTFECKYDAYSAISGNIAIETHNPRADKPSGIMVSEANIWCEVLPDQFGHCTIWFASLKRLKRFIEENKPIREVKAVGDGNANILLYRMDFLLSIFTRVDNIPAENLITVIRRLKKEK